EAETSVTPTLSTDGEKNKKKPRVVKSAVAVAPSRVSVIRNIPEEVFSRMTRVQRKTILRRMRRRCSNARQAALSAVAKRLVTVAEEETLPIPPTSPLLLGSRYHPLSAAQGEEDVRRIAYSPPFPPLYPEVPKKGFAKKHLQRVIKNISPRKDETKEEYVHRVKNVLSRRDIRPVLRKEWQPIVRTPMVRSTVVRVEPEQSSRASQSVFGRQSVQYDYQDVRKIVPRSSRPQSSFAPRTQRPPKPLVPSVHMDGSLRPKVSGAHTVRPPQSPVHSIHMDGSSRPKVFTAPVDRPSRSSAHISHIDGSLRPKVSTVHTMGPPRSPVHVIHMDGSSQPKVRFTHVERPPWPPTQSSYLDGSK
ncbi:hypothetical protein, partial [Klebsiella pneumoniae]|uniref:hypothetical protein n=1 Tax=Klebsiella pneumoniae TaxID=573 RepID=UPI001372379D